MNILSKMVTTMQAIRLEHVVLFLEGVVLKIIDLIKFLIMILISPVMIPWKGYTFWRNSRTDFDSNRHVSTRLMLTFIYGMVMSLVIVIASSFQLPEFIPGSLTGNRGLDEILAAALFAYTIYIVWLLLIVVIYEGYDLLNWLYQLMITWYSDARARQERKK